LPKKTPVNILKNIFEKNFRHMAKLAPRHPASPIEREKKKKRGAGAIKSAGLWKRLEGGGG
jgi:hypothetical protein